MLNQVLPFQVGTTTVVVLTVAHNVHHLNVLTLLSPASLYVSCDKTNAIFHNITVELLCKIEYKYLTRTLCLYTYLLYM